MKPRTPARPRTGTKPTPGIFNAVCAAHGLPKPVHEYQFNPNRKWSADWAFDGWLLVEQEGGIYGRGKPCPVCKRRPPGAHSSIERLLSDMDKYNWAAMHGFALLRFRPEQFESGEAFITIKEALRLRRERS